MLTNQFDLNLSEELKTYRVKSFLKSTSAVVAGP